LPKFIASVFSSSKTLVRDVSHIVTIEPISVEKPVRAIGLRGLLADYPEISVDKFLARKHADKELDL
jgi:hypothetical protein